MPRGSAWVRPQLTSRENRAAPSSAPALQSCPSAAAAGISEAPGIGDRAERPNLPGFTSPFGARRPERPVQILMIPSAERRCP